MIYFVLSPVLNDCIYEYDIYLCGIVVFGDSTNAVEGFSAVTFVVYLLIGNTKWLARSSFRFRFVNLDVFSCCFIYENLMLFVVIWGLGTTRDRSNMQFR